MEGIFERKKKRIYNWLGVVSGGFLALLFAFILCSGEMESLEDYLLGLFFACFGLLIAGFFGLSLSVNQKAYLRIEAGEVHGFCQYGLRLDCKLEDIAYVFYGGDGLSIHLHSGKRYNLMHLQNAYALGVYLEKHLVSELPAGLQEDTLRAEVLEMDKLRRKQNIWLLGSSLALVPLTLVTAAYTGWKDIGDFNTANWLLFSVFLFVCAGDLLLLVGTIRSLDKNSRTYNRKRRNLVRMILCQTPLLPGEAKRVYINPYGQTHYRLVIYSLPNCEERFCTLEVLTPDYRLVHTDTSGIYSEEDAEIGEELENLLEFAEEVSLPV